MNWNDLIAEITKMTPEQREKQALGYFFNPTTGDEGYVELTTDFKNKIPALEIGEEVDPE